MRKHQFIFTVLAAFALSLVFLPNLSAQTQTGALHEKELACENGRLFFSRKEKKLIPQRDEARERLVVTHARVQQPATVTLKNGDLVEFAAMWIKPGKQEQLNQYYGQAFPSAEKYGVRWLAGFVPISVYRGDLDPQVIGLNQWPSAEAFQKFIKDADLQKLLPTRDEALSRLVVNHNRVSFEEGAR
jgi:uncharacterized protein (DUF1330 family)